VGDHNNSDRYQNQPGFAAEQNISELICRNESISLLPFIDDESQTISNKHTKSH